jgi:hypothetical protein
LLSLATTKKRIVERNFHVHFVVDAILRRGLAPAGKREIDLALVQLGMTWGHTVR